MIAGTRFSARVLIFSAISGLVLTNSNLISAEDHSVQIRPNKHQSTETVRNPQNTLSNAIQREMRSARRITKPRVLSPNKEKKPSQIQQVGLTLDPRALFFKKNKPTEKKNVAQKRGTITRGTKKAAPQYQTAVPLPNAKPGQSEIQRQLEALYRRDGRTMPPMNLNALPKTANTGSAAGRGTINPAQSPSSQNIAGKPQQNVYRKPQEQRKWYDKFLPAKPKQTPKRLPQSQQIVKKAPIAKPVIEAPKTPTLPQLPAAPAPDAQPAIVDSEQPTEGLDAEELEELAEEAAERLEEQKVAATKENAAETSQETVVKKSEDEFNDLFPEMSEAEADSGKKSVVKTELPKTPFSGLVLEETGLKKSEAKKPKLAELIKESAPQLTEDNTKKEVNPFEPQPEPQTEIAKEKNLFEVPAEKVVKKEVEKLKDNPFKPQPEQKLELPAAKVEKQISTNKQDLSIEKKIALIASRGNIKGLKGFCPVALRDNRLLVDARPEFSSSFKSMNYQFASLENKLKFDREPAKYAPAAGGSDIVWLVDQQDDKEGTLDFASWYKGRLYLFSNQKNMDVFMKTPALYVGVE